MTVEFAFGDTGGGSDGTVGIGLPLLGGAPREFVAGPMEASAGIGGAGLWRGGGMVFGVARSAPGEPLELATRRIYDGVLQSSRGLNLYRIWNVVPRINEVSGEGIENYRAFCRGRSLAFEAAMGDRFATGLPAASAVGTAGVGLTVAFLGGEERVRHFENPAQVPAYEYPADYGPRSPSFARATVVGSGPTADVFISGTSAVVGHETFAPNDTARQLECTFENLALISRACGLRGELGPGARRHFKVFLRHASDLRAVAAEVGRRLLREGDRVTYLGADICRSALNVEIEVALRGAERS
jgi:chorismate lyase/3-hydroxybenzoate synthase